MHILTGLTFVPVFAKGATLAIGNFDGVHRGHQVLIGRAVGISREVGTPSGVMVFEPHPREYFHPQEPHFQLTGLSEKLALIEKLGVKLAVVQSFDAALAGLEADRFIEDILVSALSVRHVVIGYDFYFGKRRGGTPETMQAAGQKFGFGVTVVAPVAEDGEVFSSSAIRVKLAQGDIRGAAHDLGRNWAVTGPVVGGAKRGTGLGFPTANVPMPRGTALAHGIFAVRAHVGAESFDAAAYLGTRPTFDDGMPVLEVFLFDFDGDLYGREMRVEFVDMIRGDRKFHDIDELKAQMAADCEKAREILARSAT